jgi:ornithine carbamoyltransferase
MLSNLIGKSFITTEDWSNDQIESLLDMGADLKRRFAIGEPHDHLLRSKTLFMLFFEESTRTRNSFEAGITQLGGHGIYLTPSGTQVGHGENAKDTSSVLGGTGTLFLYATAAPGWARPTSTNWRSMPGSRSSPCKTM